jgi:hypothetical protein
LPKFWLLDGWIEAPSTRNMKFLGCGKSWYQLAKPVCGAVFSLPIVWK